MSDERSAGATLRPGDALGSYRIERLLGVGGMGEVFEAHDTTLGRRVAIKVLPAAFATDPERAERFAREARILASLSHPHIGAIYGIAEDRGIRALVLELIEGPTLADTIAASVGRLPIERVLAIASQIAEALEAAHSRGIVHRDLKPANIKLTSNGVVKVLDFGLAKAAAAEEGAGPTISATRVGVIAGTIAYMSPEQARGYPVDKRSDIWAFGCVLFEMLARRPVFPGPTASDVLARVLERDPEWTLLPENVPPSIRRLLRRCLQKDPNERFHDIADVRLELADAAQPWTALPVHDKAPIGRPRIVAATALAILAVILVSWGILRRGGTVEPAAPVEFAINLGDYAPGFGVAVSPDGRRVAAGVAIAGRNQILMHALDGSGTGPLAGGEFGELPFWSPDGSEVGFFDFTTGTLSRVSASGGSPIAICASRGNMGGSWSAEGVILFSSGGHLFRVPASGGAPQRVATPGDENESTSQTFPQFLPDGQHFVYASSSRERDRTIAIGSLDGAPIRRLADAQRATYVAPGLMLFLRGTSVIAQRFDARAMTLEGESSTVATNAAAGYVGGTESLSVARGILVFVPTLAGNRGQLTWFDRVGRPTTTIAQNGGPEFLNPALSPSADRVAVNRLDSTTGVWDVWVVDVARDTATRITNGPNDSTDPVWSPPGDALVFSTTRDGKFALVRRTLDSAPREEILLESTAPISASDWSRDNRYVIYTERRQAALIRALPLSGDRKPIAISGERFFYYGGRVSPDGNWIAYSSNETGVYAVYVQRFLQPGQRTKISTGTGVHPRWTKDGRELVYWSEPGGVMGVTLTFDGDRFTASAPHTIVTAKIPTVMDGRPHYDAARDGERFLLRQPVGPSGSSMTAVLNWTSRIKPR